MMNSFGKTRSILLAIGLGSAVTAGTWYGASLKIQQDVTETKKTITALSPEHKIQQLQTLRERLVTQRTELQTKIDALSDKIAANAPSDADGA